MLSKQEKSDFEYDMIHVACILPDYNHTGYICMSTYLYMHACETNNQITVGHINGPFHLEDILKLIKYSINKHDTS